jgi:hypothetical protein
MPGLNIGVTGGWVLKSMKTDCFTMALYQYQFKKNYSISTYHTERKEHESGDGDSTWSLLIGL